MTCTVCGSNANCGCSSCVTDPALPCGCGSSVTPGGCCQNVVSPTPTPYFACAPACPESHVQKITIQQFSADVKIADSWNIPGCGESAIVNGVSLRAIVVGSYLWNPEFGYFEVTAFNSGTGQMTILNHCNEGNAAPGTNVPACTEFTVVDPPCACVNTSQVCVAIDFTAPGNGDCIDITLTTVGTISAGDIIQIGSGRYRVDGVVSSTIITICNDGEGITPGTSVIAVNSAGDYQYCITIVETCCSQIEANFPDGLTPCTDFENRVITVDPTGTPVVNGTVLFGAALESSVITLTLENTSNCRDMEVMITVTISVSVGYQFAAGVIAAQFKLRENINGAGYGDVWIGNEGAAGAVPYTGAIVRTFTYVTRTTVTAGATTTILYKCRIENDSTDSGDNMLVSEFFVKGVALGVAV